VPTLETDVDDSDWTSELATGNQGTMAFGGRELRPHPLAKRIKVSKTLKRVSAIPMDALVRQRLEYKTAITKEKAYLLGDGAQKPLGVFVAHADGIPTSRDVSTGSATDFTADGLMDAKYELKQAYWPGARWAFHRQGIKRIRKLKDGQQQYIWQPGLTGGAPDTILEQPYDVSEYVPSTFTTGLYVGILANWPAGYWVVDSLDMGIEVVDQLYAEQNQDGYILRYEGDGAPVLAEAFVRCKTA
jgi:HK97 family phage major capsid protein